MCNCVVFGVVSVSVDFDEFSRAITSIVDKWKKSRLVVVITSGDLDAKGDRLSLTVNKDHLRSMWLFWKNTQLTELKLCNANILQVLDQMEQKRHQNMATNSPVSQSI
ncbi:hypothetical protein BpHYR1_008871 [Brachionus plicatilis]|uniref:Uncharacterized protein n=1 Tax=Brachionus plicatilis TaxID=10195 RepID=A0A3M7Q130_BRAPC|nr:hypothetical protein BpHYR1_008871 [Brachionus plicatilis]